MKKILVGCPTSNYHEYCLKEFITTLKSFTYKNHNVLFADNSKDDSYKKKIESYGFKVIKDKYQEKAKDRIISSRNILREFFLKENYDYLLSLEQDVIPPKNLIEYLLQHKRRIISAIYSTNVTNNRETRFTPLIWVEHKKDQFRYLKINELHQGLIKIAGAGLGCILIHKTILEKIKFRYEKNNSAFDDAYFLLDCRKNNFKMYADTNVICKHLIKNRPWKWKDID